MKPSTNATPAASRPTVRRLAFVGFIAVLLGAAIALSNQHAAPPVAGAGGGDGDFAGRVEIGGGRKVYLECRGTGGPTVILIAGYGNRGSVWSSLSPDVPPPAVLPGVAGFTRVCTYDRPGTIGDSDEPSERSRSDPVPQPRAAEDTIADLHALFHAARIPGPYVLAAHSLGGLYARLYAAAYPDEVVGLVLVDAAHEQYNAELWRLLTPEQLTDTEHGILALRERYPDFELVDAGRNDIVLRQARVEMPMQPMPLAVLSRGRAVDVPIPAFPVEELERTWRALQEDLATIVPCARHFIAGRSGHNIYEDEPALVIEAIRQVVAGIRDPDTWYGLDSCCMP